MKRAKKIFLSLTSLLTGTLLFSHISKINIMRTRNNSNSAQPKNTQPTPAKKTQEPQVSKTTTAEPKQKNSPEQEKAGKTTPENPPATNDTGKPTASSQGQGLISMR